MNVIENPPAGTEGRLQSANDEVIVVGLDSGSQALLEGALALAAHGLTVFPITAGRKCPPLVSFTKQTHTGRAAVQFQWGASHPGANVGVRTEGTGLFVVDIDSEDGHQALVAYERDSGQLPTSWTSTTPSRGTHIYLKAPDGWSVRNAVGVDKVPLDIRGHHGYVLAPPSRTSGGSYHWEIAPDDCSLAEAPLSFMQWLEARGIASTRADFLTTYEDASAENAMNPGIEEPLIRQVFERYIEELHETRERNRTWFNLACQVRDNLGTFEQAKALVTPYLEAALLIGKPDPPDRASLIRTLKSAWNGKRRDAWGDVGEFQLAVTNGSSPNKITKPPTINIRPAKEIYAMTFPPRQWAIKEVIPHEGLVVLAAAPKIGKSWLALNLQWAVSSGSSMFGRTELGCCKGHTLGIYLEDGDRRLHERLHVLSKQLGGAPPENFEVSTSWPTISGGGLDCIASWAKERCGVKVVVIDTLQRFRAGEHRGRGKNSYEVDYEVMQQVQRLALDLGIVIIAVHHTRKATAGEGDSFERISGSHGISGSADVLMLLERKRSKAEAKLTVSGRDIEERSLALKLETGIWTCLGDAEEVLVSESSRIIRMIAKEQGSVQAGDLADALGISRPHARKMLARTAGSGQLVKQARGTYALP